MIEDENLNFRSYLRREFTLRIRRNPRYSLRAFARDLEMAPSKVSEVLRGQAGLSRASATRVAKKLNFNDSEAKLFVALVELNSRSQLKRAEAQKMLENLCATHGFNELDLERFKIISDWFHGAILELTAIEGFKPSAAWVAERLAISTAEATAAVERLFRFGLLRTTPTGNWERAEGNVATPSGIPSHKIRAYHSQILQKADQSLERVPVEERDFSAVTMAIHTEQMDEARAELRNFRRRFCNTLQAGAHKDRVYCLSIQFFLVDTVKRSKFPAKEAQ